MMYVVLVYFFKINLCHITIELTMVILILVASGACKYNCCAGW